MKKAQIKNLIDIAYGRAYATAHFKANTIKSMDGYYMQMLDEANNEYMNLVLKYDLSVTQYEALETLYKAYLKNEEEEIKLSRSRYEACEAFKQYLEPYKED